jgi:hypothetical protein
MSAERTASGTWGSGPVRLRRPSRAWRGDWFRLDNAAILFPTIASANVSTLFRVSASLDAPIHAGRLQDALTRLCPRFPYFNVDLHAGVFWYYFELLRDPPLVMADSRYPNTGIRIRSRGRHLFRVRAYDNRIAVEFSHIISDGTGAMTFLKSLIAEYLRLSGTEVPETPGIFRPDDPIDPEEFEDAFRRCGDRSLPGPPHESRAFHVPCVFLPVGEYRVTTGIVPLPVILAKARSFDASLTEFLTSVHIAALQDIRESLDPIDRFNLGRSIKLMIPVNLRRLFPSKTLRNFSLYVIPGIDCRLGHYEFAEIVAAVHGGMRFQNTAKQLSQQIARNLRGAVAPAIRLIPLFMKKVGGRLLYRKLGEDLYSGCLSNLGRVDLPPEMAARVKRFDFVPAPAPITRTNCTVVSYGDSLHITFGSMIREREVERLFFARLVKMGIPVKIESNE